VSSQFDYVTSVGTILSNPLAIWSQAQVCGRSITGIVGSNPADGMDVVSCVVVQLAASATGLSPVQGNPAGYVCVCVCVSDCV
jgi:hypothetical protein